MKVKNLKISVITPSYNSGTTLERAIKSVLEQDYKNWEHIIVDGGSGDDTLKILKENKHLVWVSEKDKGQADAMNKGFRMSQGDVVVYLNADDYFFPGAFKAAIKEFERKSVFVVGNVLVKSPRLKDEFLNVPRVSLEGMLRHWEPNAFCHNPVGYFYRREVQTSCPFNAKNYATMDLEFLLDAAEKYEFTKIEHTLGCFIDGTDTKTGETQTRLDYWQPSTFPYIEKHLTKFTIDQRISYEKERRAGYSAMQSQMNKMNAEELLPVSKLPLISVIIPAYNCGPFIKKSVDSVLEQGLEKLEIIIVDDASTDNTKAILGKEYGNNPRIKIIYNAVNRKQGESRNIGLSVASGKYIFFLDADDWLERGALKHLASIAEIYKSDIVACGAKEVREDGSTQLFHAQAIACKGGEEALYQFSEYRIGSIVWNKLYARELIVKEKIEFITPYVLEDIMFTAKVIYGCRNYISVEDNYYNYLYREKSTMNGTPNELYLQSYVKLYLEMIKFIKEKNIIQDKNLSFRLFSAHCSHNVYPNIVRYIKTHSWDVWEKQCREVCYDDLGLTGYAVADIVIHSMAEREKDIADSKDKLQQKEAELTQVIKEKEQKIENINKSRIWKVRTMLLPIIKIIKRDSTYE